MQLALYLDLLAKYGFPFVAQVLAWQKENKTEVTAEDNTLLDTLSRYRSADALTAAGIAIVDGKVVLLPPK